ncbi:MAG: LysM peptidoglycan-binding domain-containing protein [Methylovulum sp.]|nr:MAG: LysM peptidoglycan-binding domain-containing protein [Methylovulum sp.]
MYCRHAKLIFTPALLLVLSVVFALQPGYTSAEPGTTAIDNKPGKQHKKPQALAVGQTYYRVKSGDTLYAIGLASGLGYQDLALWNQIAPPYLIIAGQTLKLFPPITKYQPPDTHPKILVTKSSDNAVRPTAIPAARKIQSSDAVVQKTQPVPPGIKKKPVSQEKKSIISIDNKKMLKLSFKWPIKGKVLKSFSQSGKQGIDIENKISKQPVLAAESGQIVYTGQELSGFRNLIIIKHQHEYLSAYANTSRLLAKEGQQVEKGQAVAEIGAANKQHNILHFEIRKNGNPIDPIKFLPK